MAQFDRATGPIRPRPEGVAQLDEASGTVRTQLGQYPRVGPVRPGTFSRFERGGQKGGWVVRVAAGSRGAGHQSQRGMVI